MHTQRAFRRRRQEALIGGTVARGLLELEEPKAESHSVLQPIGCAVKINPFTCVALLLLKGVVWDGARVRVRVCESV